VPGFSVSGLGAGFVNPPLASTAIGVVEPERAGMASGINSTFRQVGLATSIAALGSVFTASLRSQLTHALAPVPPLAGRSGQIVAGLRQGQGPATSAGLPPTARAALQGAIRSSFTGALNNLLVITGCVALVGAVASLLLIRDRDFVAGHEAPAQPDLVRR
jgi:hypothetical protein